jgi:chloramphenicol O-acetyltransferase type B
MTRLIHTSMVKLVAASVGENLRVNGRTKVTRNTYIGNNCNFNGLVVEGAGKVTFGDYFHSGKEILLMSQRHDYDGGERIPYNEKPVIEEITIGGFVWLGTRVTILSGVTIGEGAVIQAGSVVASDIPPYAVAGGHPAQVFKYRDIERFKRLKEEGMFQ